MRLTIGIKNREEKMKKYISLILVTIIIMTIISACSSNKKAPVVVEPPRNPLALAQESATNGNDLFEEKLYNEAIIDYKKAIDLYNEYAPSSSPADSVANNIEKLNLNIATSHLRMADESIAIQIYPEAIAHYDTALVVYKSLAPLTITADVLKSDIKQVYNNLIIAHRSAGNFESAINYVDMILVDEPNNADMLNLKFNILQNDIKDETRAFKVLHDYAEASGDANAYLILAGKYADKQDNNNAGIYYEKALTLKQDANTYSAVANFYRNTKQYAKSNEILGKLVATQPDQATLLTAYRLMGDNYNKLNNKAKMAEYFEKALSIEADDKLSLALASYYNGLKNHNKVITYATQVLKANPNSSDALILRGLAYYNLKQNAAAKADLQRIENDPKYGAQAKSILKAIK